MASSRQCQLYVLHVPQCPSIVRPCPRRGSCPLRPPRVVRSGRCRPPPADGRTDSVSRRQSACHHTPTNEIIASNLSAARTDSLRRPPRLDGEIARKPPGRKCSAPPCQARSLPHPSALFRPCLSPSERVRPVSLSQNRLQSPTALTGAVRTRRQMWSVSGAAHPLHRPFTEFSLTQCTSQQITTSQTMIAISR